MNVLFVCTGNTCRSAMAEYLFKKLLETEGLASKISVKSAGVAASSGEQASVGARLLLKQRGLDGESHQSQSMSDALANWAHLILTMTSSHKYHVQDLYPGLSDRIFTLKEYAFDKESEFLDIADPYGGDHHEFEECALEIEQALKQLAKKLQDEQS